MAELRVGQLVDVKHEGQATILSTEPSQDTPEHSGRVQVQYPDGKTYWARPNQVRPLYPSSRRVVACPTTKQYRMALIHNVGPSDCVLEIGCHEGVTTAMLHKRAEHVVGVDMSEKTIDVARKSFPHCRFEVCDGFDFAKLRSFSPREDKGFSLIGVDIGGTAPFELVASLVWKLQDHFRASPQYPTRPKLVVKSVHLCHFLEFTELFQYDEKRQWAAPPAPSLQAAEEISEQPATRIDASP